MLSDPHGEEAAQAAVSNHQGPLLRPGPSSFETPLARLLRMRARAADELLRGVGKFDFRLEFRYPLMGGYAQGT